MWLVVPLVALGGVWALLFLDVEPVPTWFYVFAWYPTLLLLDGIASRLDQREHLLANWRLAVSLFAWSAPIWLCFEAVNLRLANWYYVYLPQDRFERWAGILLSFATVVPAVVAAGRLWESAGVGSAWRTRPMALGIRDVRWLTWAGALTLAAVLVFPQWAYPLTWGAAFLIADPIVYRRWPHLSLIADLERGTWGRVGRLMLGGLLIGAIWEGYNSVARGKWIYTVPLLEHVKWFEMPPLGFLGFPFFALEAWAMYHALAVLGVAVPVAGDPGRPGASTGEHGRLQPTTAEHRRPETGTRNPLAVARLRSPSIAFSIAVVFSLVTLCGMERWTISSTVPVLDLPTAPQLASPWRVTRLAPRDLGEQIGVSTEAAAEIVEAARLMTLRGIGSAHTRELARVGVQRVCDLATSHPLDLWRRMHDVNRELSRRPTQAEVRVWVRAAQQACEW